jgi:hypothetical protein
VIPKVADENVSPDFEFDKKQLRVLMNGKE